MEITKEFIKDFKKCNTVTFHFSGEFGKIELISEKCGITNKVTTYEFTEKDNIYKAFWYIPFKEFSNIEVFKYLLKPGDIVQFENYKNNNQYTREAGLFMDELVASITNNKRKEINRLVLTYSVCPNNSARAIQKLQ